MYNSDQVINGLISYADAEIMPKLPTSGKWIAGTAITLASKRVNDVIEQLRENAIVKMLGLVDNDGNIDVDALIEAMRSSSDKYGKVSVEVPLVGRLTFSTSDIENLKNYIR